MAKISRSSRLLGGALVAAILACDGGRPPAPGPAAATRTETIPAGAEDDKPETGLQGQVPREDQESGRSQMGYRLGLELVGQTDIMSRGANFQLAWIGDCAYVTTGGQDLDPEHELNGIAVIDAADPTAPQVVSILRMPGAVNSKTALEANAARGVLIAGALDAPVLEIFDASQDCRNPVHVTSIALEVPIQGLALASDGLTAYAVEAPGELRTNPDPIIDWINSDPATDDLDELDTPLPGLLMIGLEDLADPKQLVRWDPNTHTRPELRSPIGNDEPPRDPPGGDDPKGDPVHLPQPPDPERSGPPTFVLHDIDLNERGSRVYLTNSLGEKNGVMILDVARIQRRREPFFLRIVGQIQWDHDAGGAHAVQRFMIGERTYLLVSDALPFTRACPWARSRIVEISREFRPALISTIELEVNDTANCTTTIQDGATYSAHYPAVDHPANAATAFVSWFSSGLRVFNIRDPANPEEVAYYYPPPKADVTFDTDDSMGFDAANDFWDAVTSKVRYRPETGHLWMVSITNGFQVLAFTPTAGATPPPAPTPPPEDEG